MEKQYFKIRDLVDMLGISRQAILKQIETGNLKAFRFGKCWMIEKKDFEAYKEARKSK